MTETAGAVLEAPAVTANDVTEIALIDLSSIAYPIYLTSSANPDPDFASQQIVARIRSLTAAHPKAAICCDKGKSFRAEISADYKANRPPAEAALHHQIALAKEQLEADGYPVWAIKGYEADDLIATACRLALSLEGVNVLIVSADKDLLQLVGPRVRQLTPSNGMVYDAVAVYHKFGVRPEQMCDYLTLVGDASDNVKGAKGIGPKKAAALLSDFGDLPRIYAALDEGRMAGSLLASLAEFRSRAIETGSLISLRTDAEIPFADLDNDRAAKDLPPLEGEVMETETVGFVHAEPVGAPPAVTMTVTSATPVPPTVFTVQDYKAPSAPEPVKNQSLAVPDPNLPPPPVEWSMQLEPRSMGQAAGLAKALHASRLFAAYGTEHAVLSTILAGREFGLQAMSSLRAIHIVEGKHTFSADLLRALVLKSGLAEYFRCTERTATRATFTTKRKGDGEMSLSYSIEEATQAGLVKKGSGWERNPSDMLIARAGSKLARLVYPDVVAGLYSPEEF